MRRLIVALTAVLLVLSLVPLAAARKDPPPRHVDGNFIGEAANDPTWTAMDLFEVHAGATGAVEFGYYQSQSMTGPVDLAPAQMQATVETVRFFTAETGAPAAEFTGQECILSVPAANPGGLTAGTCHWYHIIVTDGAPVGQPDTFCGAWFSEDCWTWNVVSGNVRIYS